MRARPGSRGKKEGGWVLLAGALLSILLFLFMGLVLDTGVLECQKKRAQMAADQAALSAALELRDHPERAIAAGLFSAQLNGFADQDDGATVVLRHPPLAGSYAGNPLAVEAVITRSVPVTFLTAVGIRDSKVAARATALVRAPSGGDCVYLMKPSAGVLTGGSKLQANCGVSVGSADPGARLPELQPGQCSYSDTRIELDGEGRRLQPGTYCGGIAIDGMGTISMEPGVYVLLGGGFRTSAESSLQGDGVTIYNTFDRTHPYAPMAFGGTVRLKAPKSGIYAGLLLFVDRRASASSSERIAASDGTVLEGTLYMPSARLVLSGTGTAINAGAAYTRIVAKTLVLTGGGALHLKAEAAQNALPAVVLGE